MARHQTTIAFIGFGEVGRRFSRDLRASERVRIKAYDILLDQPNRASAVVDAAANLGVVPAVSPGEACSGADVVISAVTADQTEAAAAAAGRHLSEGQIYLDVNSASPMTKIRAAAVVERSGAHYVEGAVMAAVLTPGIKVPILAGGAAAAVAAERLNALGMNLTPVSSVHGRASAIKLCRSIVIKGLEALMVDCAAATRHFDVADDVFASLRETFPSIDWSTLAADMSERVATHGLRRSAEMREAADMLAEAGLVPDLARAVADAQLRGVKPR